MEKQYAYIIGYSDSKGGTKEVIVKLPTDIKSVKLESGKLDEEEFICNWLKDVSIKMLNEAGLTITSFTVGHSDVRP